MKKRILSLMLFVLLFSLTISQAFGIRHHFELENLHFNGLEIEVVAPDEAKVNEEFIVKFDIYPYSKIFVNYLTVTFDAPYGEIYEETLLYQQYVETRFLKNIVLNSGEEGRVHCTIEISYVKWKGTSVEESYYDEFLFDLTYVTDKTREELKNDYNNLYWNYSTLSYNYTSLKSDYNDLKRDYESLETDYKNLETNCSNLKSSYSSLEEDYKNLRTKYENLERDYNNLSGELQEQKETTGFFFLTTIIFLASTIYLELKIRRVRKEQRKSSEQKGEGSIKR